MRTLSTISGFASVLALLSISAVPGFGGTGQTGQGIMVTFNAAGVYAIDMTNTYKFNKGTAAGYFTNVWDGNTPTCSPSNKCTGVTAPAAPAPDSSQVNSPNSGKSDVTGNNQCAFLAGGALVGGTYTQTADVGTGSSKTTWTFTYVITPTVSSVGPFTAWDLISSTGTGDTAHVDVSANVAGESAVSNSNNSKVGLKYSFDLGTTLSPRVVGLTISVDGVATFAPSATINFPVDFAYMTNAGSNGNTALLKDGDARTVLNTDSFAGNDNGGADGSALALASIDPVGLDLPVGTHTVTLTGTVKGNGALADLPISVTQTITVITPGCAMN